MDGKPNRLLFYRKPPDKVQGTKPDGRVLEWVLGLSYHSFLSLPTYRVGFVKHFGTPLPEDPEQIMRELIELCMAEAEKGTGNGLGGAMMKRRRGKNSLNEPKPKSRATANSKAKAKSKSKSKSKAAISTQAIVEDEPSDSQHDDLFDGIPKQEEEQ